jgi:hypothetical protein
MGYGRISPIFLIDQLPSNGNRGWNRAQLFERERGNSAPVVPYYSETSLNANPRGLGRRLSNLTDFAIGSITGRLITRGR